MMMAMAMIILLGTVGGLLLFFFGDSIIVQGQAAIMIVQNVYGMSLLVILLAYGLIKMPLYLWKQPDVKYNLMNCLGRASQYRF